MDPHPEHKNIATFIGLSNGVDFTGDTSGASADHGVQLVFNLMMISTASLSV